MPNASLREEVPETSSIELEDRRNIFMRTALRGRGQLSSGFPERSLRRFQVAIALESMWRFPIVPPATPSLPTMEILCTSTSVPRSAQLWAISLHAPRRGNIPRFHNSLGAIIFKTCCRIRDTTGVDRICLSGGSFQNMVLLHRTVVQLRRHGLRVFLHSVVPPNDGGISLGQAAVACERIRTGE